MNQKRGILWWYGPGYARVFYQPGHPPFNNLLSNSTRALISCHRFELGDVYNTKRSCNEPHKHPDNIDRFNIATRNCDSCFGPVQCLNYRYRDNNSNQVRENKKQWKSHCHLHKHYIYNIKLCVLNMRKSIWNKFISIELIFQFYYFSPYVIYYEQTKKIHSPLHL